MAKFITEIKVSCSKSEEKDLKSKGFEKIDVDLNKGAVGDYIYLWYKTGTEKAITRMQVSFNDEMAAGLSSAGYTKINVDLNAMALGNHLYLWYLAGATDDTAIVDLKVTLEASEEAPLYSQGWQRVGCDLNRMAGGKYIYAWVKRAKPMYISEVLVTDNFSADADHFKEGFVRVDETTNRSALEGAWVFLWYRQIADATKALGLLQVSSDDKEYEELKKQGYQSLPVDLNKGTTGGKKLFLWYKMDPKQKPIRALSLLLHNDAVEQYKKAGVQVIKENLNEGNDSLKEVHLAYYQ